MYGKFFILIGWLKGKLCLCPKFLLQEIIFTVVSASVGPGIDLPWLDVQGNQSGVRIHNPVFVRSCCWCMAGIHTGDNIWKWYCVSKQRLNPTQPLSPGRIEIKHSWTICIAGPSPISILALCRNKSSSNPAARFASSSPLPPPLPSKADTRALCKPPTCSPHSKTSKGPRRAPPQLEKRPLRAAAGAN